MGYTTEFKGVFRTDKPMADVHRKYLLNFSETRRMKRDAAKTATRADSVREAVGLPVGEDGGYFVGGGGIYGQDRSSDVVEYNNPPTGQPGLWCQWIPDEEDPSVICWNGAEKFYDYVEWLNYLIAHFLGPWGYKLSGTVLWQGEETGDIGAITVKDNVATADSVKLPEPTR